MEMFLPLLTNYMYLVVFIQQVILLVMENYILAIQLVFLPLAVM